MRTIYAKSSACARTVVRKWLSLKGHDLELHEKDNSRGSTESQRRRNSCSNEDEFLIIPRDISAEWLVNTSEALRPASCPPQSIRMFVGTWNVGGRAPYSDLNLREWLDGPSAATADVYVLGFQEVVPLNVGNVLGAEDRAPAVKWLSLIRRALNRTRYEYPDAPFSVEDVPEPAAAALTPAPWKPEDPGSVGNRESYRLVASKQMVGLFLCVWVRSSLLRHVTRVHVSCVGRGLMGYMGNKGSISISMRLRGTKLCFVCTHLASGEREGDETRRNTDVVKILRRTRFTPSWDSDSPITILDHDKVIWLGDLNYRLSASWDEMKELLEEKDWEALLEKDQLRREQRAGRVLVGWEEGQISFPPTYKYVANSDSYAVRTDTSGNKSRAPAWCDRILWRGKGMKQHAYVRGESRFSDHRPVCAVFSVDLDGESPPAASGGGRASWKVQAEEMLQLRRTQSCLHTVVRFG